MQREEHAQEQDDFRKLREIVNAVNTGRLEGEWSTYVSDIVYYFINNEFVIANSMAWQLDDQIGEIDLFRSKQWYQIATESPDMIEDCFSRLSIWHQEVGMYAFLRFQMVYHFGLLHAHKGARLFQNAALAGSGGGERRLVSPGMEGALRLACAGAAGLRRAYAIGREVPEGSGWGDVAKPMLLQAESMLRRLSLIESDLSALMTPLIGSCSCLSR